jgi:hypothetical protein
MTSTWWTQGAGRPVGRGDHDQVELGQRRLIPQTIQAGSAQAGAAVAVIAVDVLFLQCPAVLGDRRRSGCCSMGWAWAWRVVETRA